MAGEVMDQGTAGQYRKIRVKLGDWASPVRKHSSVRGWKRAHRPHVKPVGTLPARLRATSHLLHRRILLGRSPTLLRRVGAGPVGERCPNDLAGVQRRRITRDAGTHLDADSKAHRSQRSDETRAPAKTGA